jgi:hypothetical protein
VKASDAQWNPVRSRNQFGSTAHQPDKNPGSNSGFPQEAEREIDHHPETISNHLLVSQVWGVGWKCCAIQKTPPRVNGDLSFSWEIITTEVKGWIKKNQFQRGETPKRTDASSTIPLDSPVGII